MEQILQHYDAYINKLCLRTIVNESGQTHKQVDPYMKGCLQSKLMQAITRNSKAGECRARVKMNASRP